MARVLSETPLSRERRNWAKSAPVRPTLLAGEAVMGTSW